MAIGANPELEFFTRIANLEQAVFGGANPSGAYPLVTGQLGIQPVVYSYSNSAFGYASFGTAITMLPSTAAAGLYQAELYAVITTTITTATSWLFKLGFTDDDQAQTPTMATSSTMTAGAINQAVYTFRSSGTAAITFTPTSVSAAAGVVAVSMILSRLQ